MPHSFDLTLPSFRLYCEQQGLGHLWGCDEREAFTQDHGATRAQFGELFGRSVAGYVYPPGEMVVHWSIMQRAKDRLQEAWDQFNGWPDHIDLPVFLR